LQPIYSITATAPWGDYGATLIHGETGFELGTRDGPPREFRGVSPLSDVLLSSNFLLILSNVRDLMSESFPELSFRPVYEELMVSIPWRKWLEKGKVRYPHSREPEDYFHEFPVESGFEAGVSNRLFEVLYQSIVHVELSEKLGIRAPVQKNISLHFFAGMVEGNRYVCSVFCSEKFRDFLMPHAEYLEFSKIDL
jgi:hypothetical protein